MPASFYLGSFSYTSHAGLIFIWGVFLTHPILALFCCGEFVLHIPMVALIISGDCWLYCSVANLSYTSHATFIFVPGVCLTHPVLPSFLCGDFFYTSQPTFIFMRVVSLTYPMQASFYAGSFSYTSRADFFFMWGVCLTHPVLTSCLCGEFLLHLPYFYFFIFLFF